VLGSLRMSSPQRHRARRHVHDLTVADRALFRKNLTENAVAAQPPHHDEMAGELAAGLARFNAAVGIQVAVRSPQCGEKKTYCPYEAPSAEAI
jgi:hypothetical protein